MVRQPSPTCVTQTWETHAIGRALRLCCKAFVTRSLIVSVRVWAVGSRLSPYIRWIPHPRPTRKGLGQQVGWADAQLYGAAHRQGGGARREGPSRQPPVAGSPVGPIPKPSMTADKLREGQGVIGDPSCLRPATDHWLPTPFHLFPASALRSSHFRRRRVVSVQAAVQSIPGSKSGEKAATRSILLSLSSGIPSLARTDLEYLPTTATTHCHHLPPLPPLPPLSPTS